MAGLAPVDLAEDAPAVGPIVEAGQQEDRLGDAGQRSFQRAGATAAVEDP